MGNYQARRDVTPPPKMIINTIICEALAVCTDRGHQKIGSAKYSVLYKLVKNAKAQIIRNNCFIVAPLIDSAN